MAYPTVKVEIAFTTPPYYPYPTWTNVTSYVRSATVRRGRTDDFQNFDVGSATVVLDNRARLFDPFNTAGTYYGQLTPRRPIRISADPGTGVGYQDVYTGFIAGWPVTWTDAGYDSTVTVECFDLFGLLGDTQLPPDWISPLRRSGNYYAQYLATDIVGSTTIVNQVEAGTANAGVDLVGTTGITEYDALADGYPWKAKRPSSTMTSNGSINLAVVGTLKETAVGIYMALTDPTPSSDQTLFTFGQFTVTNTSTGLKVTYRTTGTDYTYNLGTAVQTFQPFHLVLLGDVAATGLRRAWINGVPVTLTATTTAGGSWTNTVSVTDKIIFQDLFIWAVEYAGYSDAWYDAWVALNRGLAINYYEETTEARFYRYMATSDLAAPQYNSTTTPEGMVGQLTLGGALFPALQRLADSEGGEMYVDKAGTIQFTNRSYAAAKGAGTAAATFDDTGTNLKYGTELDIEYNADTVRNSITLNYSGGNTYQTENSTSVNAIGRAEFAIETETSTAAQAASLAAFYVGTGSALKPQVSAIDVSPNTTNAAWATILGLELLDKITVTRTPSTGSVFTQGLCINQIQHDITPNQWKTTLLGSGRYVGWFVLNVSALDGPDLLV